MSEDADFVLSGNTFIFDNEGRARAAFHLRVEEHPDLNLYGKVGVKFADKAVGEVHECEVFDLDGKELSADDSNGTRIMLGSRVRGKVTKADLEMLLLFNAPSVRKVTT